MNIDSPAYQKAFQLYLRYGFTNGLHIKSEEHPTEYYIWRTSGDDKVRASHAANEGKIFAWDNPPPTGNPGEDFNCRCWAEPYYSLPDDPPIEPVYPELLLLPLLRVRWLYDAWHAWSRQRSASRDWQLSPTKTNIKWRNQIEKGKWTPEKISDVIRTGKTQAVRNERNGGPATLYQKGEHFVVRDDKTGDILQLSRPGFKPKRF